MRGTRLGRAGSATALVVLLLCAAAAPAPATPGQITLSPDGLNLYVADYQTTTALRRDPDTGALTRLGTASNGGGHGVEVSPDGRHVYTVSRDYTGAAPPSVHAYARDPGTGALTYVGRWSRAGGLGLADLEFRDDRTAYLTDQYTDSLIILDRDLASGRLALRRELRNGHEVPEGLGRPVGMALAPGWLYVSATAPGGITAFRLADDGEPTMEIDRGCDCQSSNGLDLTPDGRRMVAGPFGPFAYDRDSASGQLTELPHTSATTSGGDEVPDGAVAFSPDGRSVYSADWWDHRMLQFDSRPGGMTLRRSYFEGRDGQGLSYPRSIAVSGDGRHLYLASGSRNANDSGGISHFARDTATGDLTFVAPLPGGLREGDPPAPVLRINDGDEYTNDPKVLLSIENLGSDTRSLQISNDGGFKNSQGLDVDETNTYPWTLASSGPDRLAKTVYVRLIGTSPYSAQPMTDEIVLDERPPSVVSARRAKGRLTVKARDALSGVSHIQATRNKRKPGKWIKFSTKVSVPAGRGRIHVRVRDRAANRSKWRAVKP